MRALAQTQVNVALSLTVKQADDSGNVIVDMLPLLSLTWLLMLVWNIRLTVNRTRYGLAIFKRDLDQALTITGKLLAITFNTFTFAMGVSL